MSYDDHPFIRELYKGYQVQNAEWTYNFSTENRNKGKELIIKNY